MKICVRARRAGTGEWEIERAHAQIELTQIHKPK